MRLSFTLRSVAALAVALLGAPAHAARDDTATVTQVSGPSTLFSDLRAYLPEPGVKLARCDIVRTGPQGAVQVEFRDGAKIEIGPESRFLSDLSAGSSGVVGPQFLLSGWVKITVPKRDQALPHRIDTPHFDLLVEEGVAVLHVDADGGRFFVERGRAVALEPGGATVTPVRVSAGSTYARQPGQSGTIAPRADAVLVKSMPRSYRDTLPALLPRIAARDVARQPAPGAGSLEVESWLKSDPDLRHCLMTEVVRSAQATLVRQGFDVGPIDGVLGGRTQAALREFQHRHGLPRSGRLDDGTLAALDAGRTR